MCALRALCIVTIVTLWLWRQGLLHNHVRTKTIMCALRALCIVDHCDVWLWRQGLLQPGVTGSSALQDEVTHYRAYRARCHFILAMGHFILADTSARHPWIVYKYTTLRQSWLELVNSDPRCYSSTVPFSRGGVARVNGTVRITSRGLQIPTSDWCDVVYLFYITSSIIRKNYFIENLKANLG